MISTGYRWPLYDGVAVLTRPILPGHRHAPNVTVPKTLRLVARYADACNLPASSPDDVAHKLDVLRAHCDAEGRDYNTIRKTAIYTRARP